MVGPALREGMRYTALYDTNTGVWRLLDKHDENLKMMGPDDPLDDNSSYMTVITEAGFEELIFEADRIGLLDDFKRPAPLEERIAELDDQTEAAQAVDVQALREALTASEEELMAANNYIETIETKLAKADVVIADIEPDSESYKITKYGIDMMERLVAMQNAKGITENG